MVATTVGMTCGIFNVLILIVKIEHAKGAHRLYYLVLCTLIAKGLD